MPSLVINLLNIFSSWDSFINHEDIPNCYYDTKYEIKNKKAYVCIVDGNNLIPEFNVDIAMQKIETEDYVVKFAINSDKVIEVNDELRGIIKFNLSLIEDPIIIKSDGFPTYHFANVIFIFLYCLIQINQSYQKDKGMCM